MYLYCIVITFMPLIIKLLKLTMFLTNSCLVLVFSACIFWLHDVIMYRAHGERSALATAPLSDLTFAIQTYDCFSFIEYVPWQKCGLQLMKLRFSLEPLSFFISHMGYCYTPHKKYNKRLALLLARPHN